MPKALLQPTRLSTAEQKYVNRFIPQSEPRLPQNQEIVKVCEPDLGQKEIENVNECMRTSWISSQGYFTTLFEERFAEYCQSQSAVSVTNGTHALHLALAALNIQPGDEVIIPTFTMIATANAVRYLGATPVFVDARPDTWNIDETKIEAAITPKTKAIIVVHIYGHPAEMDVIRAIAKKHDLWLIEDAAEAHGATYKGQKTGSMSDVACFSFYANKLITTGEGGMVVTSNPELQHLLFKLHNHAFADDIHFWHEYLGYNYRMNNLQAAIGCAQLERIDSMLVKRRRNAALYKEILSSVSGIQFPIELAEVKNSYWMFGIVLQKEFPLTRDQLRRALAEEGIETRTFFIPMHFQPIYFKRSECEKFPVANMLCKQGLYMPSASTLTSEKIEYICSKLKQIVKKA